MDNKSKKSNREGTGKKSQCNHCNKLIPFYKKYCDRECYNQHNRIIITCIGCGVEKSLPKNKSETKYCSKTCASKSIDRSQSHKKAINTIKEKYGVDNPFLVKGYENMIIDRNGEKISSTFQNKTEEEKKHIAKKISDSLKNKTEEEKVLIKNKREQTNLLLYNVKNTLEKNSPLREKAQITSRNNQISFYNTWLKNNNLELLDEYKGTKNSNGEIIYYTFKHTPSGNTFIDHLACGRLPIYKDSSETIGISNTETDIVNFIKQNYKKEIITNNRKLVKGFEIDIYIPDLNVAIEFNGLLWHSESKGKLKNYHLYKTEECEKQNIQLIHIFEDEWKYKQSIVKSRLLNILKITPNKIYARKCIIKEISSADKNTFLKENHIQGEDKSKIKLGLYHNDELISIMTFGKLRKVTGNNHIENHFELIRFCNKINTNVVGGFSKLFKYFIATYKPKQIISYADRRWSIGDVYEKNNFVFSHNSSPNYWYMKYYNYREHRFKYNKHSLSKILPIFDPNLSEWENMKINKYDRIWDCGSKKYIFEIKSPN
jgi:hypothetical protein